MSVSKINMFVKVPKSSVQIQDAVQELKSGKHEQLQAVSNFLQGLQGGTEAGLMVLEIGDGSGSSAVTATGTVTIASSGAQSVTINGKALTGGTDYVIANLTAAQVAANLCEAIGLSQSSRVQAVYADVSGAVVTLHAKASGEVGNLVTLAVTGAASRSGANLANGADGTQDILKFNLNS